MKAPSFVCSALLVTYGVESGNEEETLWSGNPKILASATAQLEAVDGSDQADGVPEGLDPLNYALAKYGKYPEEVRLLIRRADIENSLCRGGSGNSPETLRACNRRELLMIELEKRGWCWGGADVGYLEHWLRCADDPYRPPGYRRTPHFYSEEEIEERTNSGKNQ